MQLPHFVSRYFVSRCAKGRATTAYQSATACRSAFARPALCRRFFVIGIVILAFCLQGCGRTLDAVTIVGTWTTPQGAWIAINSDGSYSTSVGQQGTYQLFDNNRITFRYPGLLGIEVQDNETYNLNGDNLTMNGSILGLNVSTNWTRKEQ